MSVGAFYVCDSCGSIEVRDTVPEGDEWTCGNCGSHAAWEFPHDRRPQAEAHAAHIVRHTGRSRDGAIGRPRRLFGVTR